MFFMDDRLIGKFFEKKFCAYQVCRDFLHIKLCFFFIVFDINFARKNLGSGPSHVFKTITVPQKAYSKREAVTRIRPQNKNCYLF